MNKFSSEDEYLVYFKSLKADWTDPEWNAFWTGYNFKEFLAQQRRTAMTEVSKKVMEELLALSAGAEEVEAGLADHLVKEDLNKKVTALASCYKKWLKLRGEIKKAERPDQISIDPKDGKTVSSTFSKKAFEALKTLRDKAGKLERAVEKALKEEDYGDVYNIAQSKDDSGSKSEEASDTDAS